MDELHEYEKDGAAIYRASFATIREEADLSRVPADLEKAAVRLIHACGMVDLVEDMDFSADVASAAKAALQAGKPILCDSEMVAHGVTRKRLPADNQVICTLRDERVPEHAAAIGNTRSAAALDLWEEHLEGSVVAIGNAPTVLFHLLNRLAQGGPRPAAVLGFPVGFIGAAESKEALAATRDLPFMTVHGRRGGSAMAAAAVNALASETE
ncbi:precorrin-8X methylmutase [Halospina denitrificans]|uniref:Precorrin-8X methylmutase n=1 Tax=Halospina denitrificans TaxID=332522 RepID=A0A4R7JQA1_9GAMM|nr:precorrin-8X methylmutase [Halospina denitrificans]TDT40352.1 precorrin-8X methylmutase [Halospina denitrificans]